MTDRFCGIDPPALADLALRLDRIAADVDVRAGHACGRLTRHARRVAADRTGTQLAHVSRWARLSAADLKQRAAAINAAQTVGPWEQIEGWRRDALGIWNGRHDETFPIGRWVAGVLYVNRVAGFLHRDRPVPTVANGWAMRQLANIRYARWLNNPVVQTVGRRASTGLAAYSTISDGMAVYDHGNPISAFERDGAGYVADVARLGFSTSTTAFLVAPNPITGGVVIVTGVVWAGAEVVDHWDEIAEFWGETSRDLERGADWLYDELTGAHDWADNQASAVDDWARHQLDHLSRGWDWTADLASDLAGGRLDDARSWVDDRFDDLVHAGGGIVDGGIDVGRKIIPGW